jgi:hypothetical protein
MGRVISSKRGTKAPATISVSGTAAELNFALSDYLIVDMTGATGDVTLTALNDVAGESYFIEFIENTGSHDVIFPSSFKFAGQTAPFTLDLTTGAGSIDAVAAASNGSEFIANTSQAHG